MILPRIADDPTGFLVLAHGLGGRSDLPPNARMAAIGAAIAVAVSFAIVVVAFPDNRIGDSPRPHRTLRSLSRLIDHPAFVGTLRAVVLLASAVVVAVALFGPPQSRFNLAPYALYVVFWVGLAFASVLFGPVWRVVNPLRTLHAGICRLARHDAEDGIRALPPSVGVWPAAAALLIFVWLELVYPDRAQPYVVGVFLTTYSVVTVMLALVYGRRWFDAGDGFEVYSRLFGSLSVFGRRDDRTLVLRSPLQGLAALQPVPGLAAAVIVLIGSTGFDGLTRTSFWQQSVPPDSVPLGTAGLLVLIATVAILYVVAVRAGTRAAAPRNVVGPRDRVSGARLEPAYAGAKAADARQRATPPPADAEADRVAERRPSAAAMPSLFAPSLVPIALGYTIAHYFSFFLFEGQTTLALVSDPFGLGWDLFGTVDRSVNYQLVSTAAIARVQVYSIVLGHICGVIAAHDRALTVFGPTLARRSQYPLAAVMIAITLGGVLLLLSG